MPPVKTHIITSAVLAITLYPVIGLNTIIVFLSGVLIDFDHYLQYVIDFKDFSLKKSYKYFTTTMPVDVLQIFHVVEFWIILFVMALFIEALRYIIVGMAVHLTIDFLDMAEKNIKGVRATSAIMWVLRRVN